MRTTLTLDPDVASRAKAEAADHNIAFKTLVNEALRLGLDAYARRANAGKPYRTQAAPLGLKPGLSHDRIGELLAQREGDAFCLHSQSALRVGIGNALGHTTD